MWSRSSENRSDDLKTSQGSKRPASSSPDTPPGQTSFRSSEKAVPKRLMMEAETQPKAKPTPIDVETMKLLLEPINTQLNELVTTSQAVQKSVGGMQGEISTVKADVERISRQQLAKTVIIYGMEEQANENYKDMDKKIEELKSMLQMPNLDFDMARRMGSPRAEQSRPIELTLLRQRDKFAIFEAKSKLHKTLGAAKIYINPARTRNEQENYKKMLDFAKQRKARDSEIKFRIIRGHTLEIHNGKTTLQYHVDASGDVTEQDQEGTVKNAIHGLKGHKSSKNHPTVHKVEGTGGHSKQK